MKLTINCAYCDRAHTFQQGDFKSAMRSLEMFAFKCAACDSTTSVELSTKRKRQGAGYKAIVQRREDEHARKVAAAVKRNAMIAEQLLAMPGCTCGEHQTEAAIADDCARFGRSSDRAERLAQYGHLFNTRGVTYGIPCAPHHDHKCPCRNTAGEAKILESAGRV